MKQILYCSIFPEYSFYYYIFFMYVIVVCSSMFFEWNKEQFLVNDNLSFSLFFTKNKQIYQLV